MLFDQIPNDRHIEYAEASVNDRKGKERNQRKYDADHKMYGGKHIRYNI